MTQKIKKEIYIDSEQDERLKWLSELLGITEDDIIQRAISSYMKQNHKDDHTDGGEGLHKRGEVVTNRHGARWRNREEFYEETLAERGKPIPGLPDDIDESEIERRWQKELYKMRDRRFVRLLGDTESDWDRNRIYDERINDLPG